MSRRLLPLLALLLGLIGCQTPPTAQDLIREGRFTDADRLIDAMEKGAPRDAARHELVDAVLARLDPRIQVEALGWEELQPVVGLDAPNLKDESWLIVRIGFEVAPPGRASYDRRDPLSGLAVKADVQGSMAGYRFKKNPWAALDRVKLRESEYRRSPTAGKIASRLLPDVVKDVMPEGLRPKGKYTTSKKNWTEEQRAANAARPTREDVFAAGKRLRAFLERPEAAPPVHRDEGVYALQRWARGTRRDVRVYLVLTERLERLGIAYVSIPIPEGDAPASERIHSVFKDGPVRLLPYFRKAAR